MPKTKVKKVLRSLGPGARIACYCRDSDGDNQELSIPRQHAELVPFAEARGWVIVEWFDESRSGADVEHRPVFQRMISVCHRKPPPFDGVLVWRLARFGRDEYRQYYIADLRVHGVEVISATEEIPSGFAGIYESLLSWKDSQALEDISVQAKSGLQINADLGYVPGHPAAGFKGVKEQHVKANTHRDGSPRMVTRWVIDPAVAPRVLEAFQMRVAGASVFEIHAATHLHHSTRAYFDMFHSKVYIGTLTCGGVEYPGRIPQIVPLELWKAVQALPRKEVRKGSTYLLTGRIWCKSCDLRMQGHKMTKNRRHREYHYSYYECRLQPLDRNLSDCPLGRIRAEVVEDTVMADIEQRILDPDVAWRLVEEARKILRASDDASTNGDIKAKIDRCQQALARLARALADPLLDFDQVRDQVKGKRQELAVLEAQLANNRALAAITDVSYEHVKTFVGQLQADLRSGKIEQARSVLRRLVKRIDCYADGRIEVTYFDSLPAFLADASGQTDGHRNLEPLEGEEAG